MKSILLFLFTVTLAFSSERKMILGTYSQINHASNALVKANHLLDTDHALKIFMDLNHLSIQIDKIDNYNVVSVKTFTNNKELFYVLAKFNKHYPDLYVLPPYKSMTTHKSSVKSKIKIKKEKIAPVVVKEIEPAKKIEEIKKEEVNITTKEPKFDEVPKKKIVKAKVIVIEAIPEIIENDILPDEEIDGTFNKTNLFNYQIAITIIIAVILLMILINTIIKLRNSSKREKYKPYSKDD